MAAGFPELAIQEKARQKQDSVSFMTLPWRSHTISLVFMVTQTNPALCGRGLHKGVNARGGDLGGWLPGVLGGVSIIDI